MALCPGEPGAHFFISLYVFQFTILSLMKFLSEEKSFFTINISIEILRARLKEFEEVLRNDRKEQQS